MMRYVVIGTNMLQGTIILVTRTGRLLKSHPPEHVASARRFCDKYWYVFALNNVMAVQLVQAKTDGQRDVKYGILTDSDRLRYLQSGYPNVKKSGYIDIDNSDTYVKCHVPGCNYKARCLISHLKAVHSMTGTEYKRQYGGELFCKESLTAMSAAGKTGASHDFNRIVQKVRILSREQRERILHNIDKEIERGDWREKYKEPREDDT